VFEREQWLLEKDEYAVAWSEGFLPNRMSAAYLLSTLGRWKITFQREHGLYTKNLFKDIFSLEHNVNWPSDTRYEDG
jgi:hypothetical protein